MPRKNYKRRIVAYKNYFKEFKKTLSLQTLKNMGFTVSSTAPSAKLVALARGSNSII